MMIHLLVIALILCAIAPPVFVQNNRICLYSLYIAMMYIIIRVYINASSEGSMTAGEHVTVRMIRGG